MRTDLFSNRTQLFVVRSGASMLLPQIGLQQMPTAWVDSSHHYVRSTTIYFTVCLFSVGGESFWKKIWKKNKHTHMLELPVIFHIKTKTLEHVAKNWHSSKGNSNQNQGYTHPKNVAMQM